MNGPIHNNPVSALLVGDYENDRLLVHNVFGRLGWRLFEAPNRRHALQCLHQHPVQVVMAESSIPQWNWKRVLRDLRNLTHPPQLIVTSRNADESLWAEVLNVGGYDLLARPFDADEIERVVAAAFRHYIPLSREHSYTVASVA
jgi:DNA-binding response OmpR family regulator